MTESTRRAPRALRILLPALLIVGWFVAGSIGGPYFGRIDEVSSNDRTTYLPASAQSTEVERVLEGFRDDDLIPAIVVITGDGVLDDDQLAAIDDVAATIADLPIVADTPSPALASDDGEAVQIVVPLDASGEIGDAVGELDAALADLPAGLAHWVTGPAGFSADLVAGFAGIDGILLLVALGAVFVILVLVYRSPLLPILVLLTSVFALTAALLTVWWLAKAGVFLLNGQVQGILFILVIGAATDYSLLYVSRYREALRDVATPWQATWVALRGSVEPILASGGTVIAGLLCLLLSDLTSNKALGPVAAIGIAVAVLASLTFLPALLVACGRASFWPLRPRFGSAHPPLIGDGAKGLWPAVGRLVAKRRRILWISSTVLLCVLAIGLVRLDADGVPQSDLVLGASPARDGQVALAEHFPGGSGSPATVVVDEGDLQAAADLALDLDGVDSVAVLSEDSPSGSVAVTRDGVQPAPGPPAVDDAGRPVEPEPGIPTVVDGRVALEVTLADAADSVAAEDTVRALRADYAAAGALAGAPALVGGSTATDVDTNDTSIRDRTLIIPVVLLVILVILMLLLRSIVAPLVLIGSVILSFAAALGVSALVFEFVFGFPGADPAVPLFGFVFLVALGVDYNIFLMTRVREESLAHGTRAGILRGLSATGGVITSAGVVLAATFAALGVIPILFLAQIAFIVAFGVLLDTFLVRSLLVPALAYDLDHRTWWPSRRLRA